MTYNRMEAKPIASEHCRFCGESDVPLMKTPCCQQWICCDTAWVSIQGGGFCQVEHERFSLCYSHYIDCHSGVWQNCQKCRDSWTPQEYQVAPQLTVVMLPLPFPVVVSAWVDVLGVWVQPKGAGGP